MTAEQARSVLESVNAFHPLGRHGYPVDVVEAILFLAGDRAGWITGTTLPIDGGGPRGPKRAPGTGSGRGPSMTSHRRPRRRRPPGCGRRPAATKHRLAPDAARHHRLRAVPSYVRTSGSAAAASPKRQGGRPGVNPRPRLRE
jgi:hypothetical protein